MDWSLGRYEDTASELEPAAAVLVDHADPHPGERALDVGCGTGNAALLLARHGARVVGVDPASRLLAVARERAAADDLDVEFAAGDAANLPAPDSSADLIVSVFGVIFAPDPAAAAAEFSRVLARGGRIVLTAWIPDGPISRVVRIAREAMPARPDAPPPFRWHERDALSSLFGAHDVRVALHEHRLAFTAPSPEAYLDGEMITHPMWLMVRPELERRGKLDATRGRALEILTEENEEPGTFRVTSRYVVAVITAR
jgi:SAM-dependent methyltransferase